VCVLIAIVLIFIPSIPGTSLTVFNQLILTNFYRHLNKSISIRLENNRNTHAFAIRLLHIMKLLWQNWFKVTWKSRSLESQGQTFISHSTVVANRLGPKNYKIVTDSKIVTKLKYIHIFVNPKW